MYLSAMNENSTTMEQMAPMEVARAKAWLAGMLPPPPPLRGGIRAGHGAAFFVVGEPPGAVF